MKYRYPEKNLDFLRCADQWEPKTALGVTVIVPVRVAGGRRGIAGLAPWRAAFIWLGVRFTVPEATGIKKGPRRSATGAGDVREFPY
jgi:hypothetical protein